jgi:hypothetical protein
MAASICGKGTYLRSIPGLESRLSVAKLLAYLRNLARRICPNRTTPYKGKIFMRGCNSYTTSECGSTGYSRYRVVDLWRGGFLI